MRPQPDRAPVRALALAQGPRRGLCGGFRAGPVWRSAESRALAEDLERDFPRTTFVQSMYLPTLRALFSLNARDPAAAIQALQSASRYDLASWWRRLHRMLRRLYPIYVRGEAYLRRASPQRPPPSSSGFSITVASSLVDPDERHGTPAAGASARALGRHVKAKSAYNDLFTLWKDADQDLPVVRDARAEYARLP